MFISELFASEAKFTRGGNGDGTSLQGYIVASYDQLVDVFGEPDFGPNATDGDKITCEWVINLPEVGTATIYDWKEGETPMSKHRWHVGGRSPSAAWAVQEIFDEKHKANESYDDDEEQECHVCSGTGEGRTEHDTCYHCHGSGMEPASDEEEYDDYDDVDQPMDQDEPLSNYERYVNSRFEESSDLDEDEYDNGISPVSRAITNRIIRQRVDLLSKYGPAAVTAAIDDVADWVGDVDEIGTSDVSAWVAQVERMLKENPPEAFGIGNQDDM